MTTYATSTTQPSPPIGGPPATPPLAGGPPTQRTPRPRRAGIVLAACALVTAAVATAATAAALASPSTPAQHTVNVVPPPPAEYSNAEVRAAKSSACAAWEQAALATAAASKERAAVTAPGSIDERFDARATEKRVSMAEISYLRTQIEPAAPETVVTPIEAWIASEIDRLHSVNMRDWPAASAALNRGNGLVDVIAPACGLR